VAELPEGSNLYATLHGSLTAPQVVELFVASGWSTRKSGRDSHELRSNQGELVLEAQDPLLLHGALTNVLENAPRVADVLRQADIKFALECYGPNGELLAEISQ